MTPPIQYFQVTAAIIPAFLTALALSMRGGSSLADKIESESGQDRRNTILSVVLVVLMIVASEVSSLIALVSDRGSLTLAAISFAGVQIVMTMLMRELTDPIFDILSKREKRVVGSFLYGVYWIGSAAFIVFGYFVLAR